MNARQENVWFFEWFEQEYYKNLQVLKNGEKLWKTSRGEISSVIPPLEEIKFPNIENKEVIASPFKMISEKREVNIKDIQNIHSQLNYTNQLIHQVALNNSELESKLGKSEPSARLGKSLIKPFKFSEEELKNLKIGRDSNTALEEINKKLDELKISKINTIKNDEEQINKINKGGFARQYPTSRNFYNRPTLPDIQFEEWELEHPSAFDGNGITEWNIDGMTDHQILRKTHEITMAASAYRVKHSEEQTIKLIVAGFTGILKGWWDNYLSPENRLYITTCVKNEENTQIPLMVETLVTAIIHNFIGDPKIFEERTSILLHNLKCPTLGDFRWYVDNFMSMVLTREDCREPYWKEKFVAGLPLVFAERVKENLQLEYPDTALKDLTYGRISAMVKNTGVALCNTIKIENRIKRNQQIGIKEFSMLGNFISSKGGITLEISPREVFQNFSPFFIT